MKKKIFYMMILVFILSACFSGCTESSSTESKNDKRALDSASTTAKSDVMPSSTTTLTPLQTFERITAMEKQPETVQTTEVSPVKKAESVTVTENDMSDWFEENKLFDMKLKADSSSDAVVTWYDFPLDKEETTVTTASVTNAVNIAETLGSMITRSAADFVPGE
ncbi:MAG: hypothetical protein IJA12_02080 [Oscillospiraceae bacterium]|nr:hypothetical protein [Oscillospiraceae bacterium]